MIRPLMLLGLASAAGLAMLHACKPQDRDGCAAPLPAPGVVIVGTVYRVIDGDGLCAGAGPEPSRLVEIRLADFNAPEWNEPGGREARAALHRIAQGERAVCTVSHHSYDRAVALCTLDGISVGAWMRTAGIAEGGR